MTFANGDKYSGAMRGELRHGYGVCCFASGGILAGNWCDDVVSGQGRDVLIGPDGHKSLYCGQFSAGVRSGAGVAMFDDAIYVGQWEDGAFHGAGVLLDCHNSWYQGQWAQGKRQGTGTRSSRDGI